MTTFTWQVPTRVRRGTGVLDDIGPETAALGPRAAVVVDRRISFAPVVAAAVDQLAQHSVATVTTHVASGTPSLADVAALVRRMTDGRAAVVVGIGGGATMDLAKTAALAVCNADLLAAASWESTEVVDLYQARSLVPGLPTLLVPSTAATGSEVNPVVAIEHGGRRRLLLCGALVASTALVDPRLLASLPTVSLLEGALETFVRLLCPYLSDGRSALDVTDRVSEALCSAALSLGDLVAAGGRDAEVEAELHWLGTLSGTHVATVGRPNWGHTLWYLQSAVGEMTGLSKGPAIAALLPAFVDAVAGGSAFGVRLGDATRLSRMIDAVAPALGGGPNGPASAASRLLERWDLPTNLGQLGVHGDALDRLALLAHRRWSRTGHLEGASHADFLDFYRRAASDPIFPAGTGAGMARHPEGRCVSSEFGEFR